MNTITSCRLLIAPLIPMASALLILASGKKPNLRETFSITGAILTFLTVASLVPHVIAGGAWQYNLVTIYPGISLDFRMDGLGAIFSGTASLLWILAAVYCIGYMRGLDEHAQTRFYLCYAVSVGAGVGAAFAGSLFTLYLFYEIISIFTYPLVMHHQDPEGYYGGRKYIIYLMFASKALLLPAMAMTYVMCGSLDFSASGIMNGVFPASAGEAMITVTYLLFLFGFAKAAIMPLHNWLPDAMVAPTPVSALLHAVVVVKVGVFSICRVMLSLYGVRLLEQTGLGMFTAWFVSFTIIAASIIALTKDNLKARLAYSTVSQLSYIVLGVAMLTPRAITGGVMHIANHAFAKITLFFCAGAIFVASRKKDISEMKGLGRAMPLTFAAFAVASLSMIGVPPVSGFVSKWYLLTGAIDARQAGLVAVLLASTFLNAAYFAPVVFLAFFGTPPAGSQLTEVREASPALVAPLLVTAALSVAAGLYPELFVRIIREVFP